MNEVGSCFNSLALYCYVLVLQLNEEYTLHARKGVRGGNAGIRQWRREALPLGLFPTMSSGSSLGLFTVLDKTRLLLVPHGLISR